MANWGKRETTGTVINIEEEVHKVTGEIELRTTIGFYVDGREYEDYLYISDAEIGDRVKTYYYSVNGENYIITRYHTDNKTIYIPAFIMGILIIILKFKNNFHISNKNQSK